MDWGNESPLMYTLLYVVLVAIAELVLLLLFTLPDIFGQGGESSTNPVLSIDPATAAAGVVLLVTPVYILFVVVNWLVKSRIDSYHERAHGLPTPDSVEESDLLSVDAIDRDTAEELFESGYESTDHLELAGPRTIANDSDVGQRTAEQIKSELDERESE
jgi:hypothetical protein